MSILHSMCVYLTSSMELYMENKSSTPPYPHTFLLFHLSSCILRIFKSSHNSIYKREKRRKLLSTDRSIDDGTKKKMLEENDPHEITTRYIIHNHSFNMLKLIIINKISYKIFPLFQQNESHVCCII